MNKENIMPQYAVDGFFFTQRLSGIQRYAIEILAELDSLMEPESWNWLSRRIPPFPNTAISWWCPLGAGLR